MTPKEMKKLNRADLLRIIVRQQEKIEALEEDNSRLKEQLEDKRLTCQKAGNIAQAALELNKVFEAAQKAADQYLENIRIRQDGADHE